MEMPDLIKEAATINGIANRIKSLFTRNEGGTVLAPEVFNRISAALLGSERILISTNYSSNVSVVVATGNNRILWENEILKAKLEDYVTVICVDDLFKLDRFTDFLIIDDVDIFATSTLLKIYASVATESVLCLGVNYSEGLIRNEFIKKRAPIIYNIGTVFCDRLRLSKLPRIYNLNVSLTREEKKKYVSKHRYIEYCQKNIGTHQRFIELYQLYKKKGETTGKHLKKSLQKKAEVIKLLDTAENKIEKTIEIIKAYTYFRVLVVCNNITVAYKIQKETKGLSEVVTSNSPEKFIEKILEDFNRPNKKSSTIISDDIMCLYGKDIKADLIINLVSSGKPYKGYNNMYHFLDNCITQIVNLYVEDTIDKKYLNNAQKNQIPKWIKYTSDI